MCGIAGCLVERPDSAEELERTVLAMADTIAHRGPDDSGTWVDAQAGIALGFRRLAILDLSPAGHQPMLSADGRFVIVFNGEIYNFQDLRRELEALGWRFRGTSDTEVILAGASQWGAEAAIPRLWGMFAIALWDRADRTLVLARDRLGKKPLYYASRPGSVVFGSELKALRAHPAVSASLDRDALVAYLRFGYVPAPRTIYAAVSKLGAGCLAVVTRDGGVRVRRYWDARTAALDGVASRRTAPAEADVLDEADALIRDAVARRMIADVPLGAFLSGGIDSSIVVALMQAQSSTPVRTFTIGTESTAFDESAHARDVARHLGTAHTELYASPDDAREVIPSLADIYDEPFADSSQIPTYLVSRLARPHVTVALSGDGGDEVFGGYTRYVWGERLWSQASRVPPLLRRAGAASLALAGTATLDRVYEWSEPLVPSRWRQRHVGEKLQKVSRALGAGSSGALYRSLVSLWDDPASLATGGVEPSTPIDDDALDRVMPRFAERMMVHDLRTYLTDDILVKVDRASMAVSLETRAPLLDHRLIEWIWRLPLEYRCRDGVGKWLLRRLLARHVPPSLFERPKSGFAVPVAEWLRGPLRGWADDLLAPSRLARDGLLNPGPIRAAWSAHLSGERNEQHRLWVVLMLQTWLDRWQPSGAS